MKLSAYENQHMEDWIRRTVFSGEQVEVRRMMNQFLSDLDQDDFNFWVNAGWPAIRDQACK